MIVAGLTGSIACGKSTVSRTLRANNIPVIDADIVAREVVVPGSPGLEQIVNHFGKEYLQDDGCLNRTKLGQLVFSNKEALSQLNHIMDPLIQIETYNQLQDLQDAGHSIAVYDAALLIENGNADKYRPLIIVSCPQDIQLNRLMSRNNLTREEAIARINAQLSTEEKVKFADYVIDTSRTIQYSQLQTEVIIKKLKELNKETT